MKHKIILPLKFIPDGSIVTKKTGTYKLTVRNKISIHSDDPSKRVEVATPGMKFIVSPNGNIAIHPDSYEVVWEASLDEIFDFEKRMEGR